MKYILFDTEPFCFGPISTTLNIIREIQKWNLSGPKKVDIILVTQYVTSKQLATATGLIDKIVEIDMTNRKQVEDHLEFINNASLYICNTHYQSIHVLNQFNIKPPVIFVDPIIWLWEKLYGDLSKVDTLFLQNFVEEEIVGQIRKFSKQINNPRIVNPIINTDLETCKKKEDLIVINFGGIENHYNKSEYYVHDLLKIIVTVITELKLNETNKVIVGGGGNQIMQLKNEFENPENNIFVDVYGQNEFLDYVRKSKYLLSLPGLTSFYESIYYQANTFFIMPQNYSQVLQLRKYKMNFINIKGANFENFPEMPRIDESIKEEIALKQVKEGNRKFFANKDFINIYKDMLKNFFSHTEATGIKENFLKIFSKRNYKSGAQTIAERIITLLS